ncbi:VOC family protein [Sedimentitalea sp. JM2-8]|uniref:VOC family protein n=1 Tax=Sedimentitalea xiamensis TaxID=3050037 RepID=A0ABT7FL10_9RHOB|nr:VOC family protein [Sedimentitalea xiamensis]MDK3075748.1 VOC family protein [Sedimentitalea xiamensis]
MPLPISSASWRGLAVALTCFVLVACAPAMRQDKQSGSIAWFDLATDAPGAAERFYGDLFGWRFANGLVEDTRVISSGNEFIGGLVAVPGNETRVKSSWEPILSVDDTMTALQTAKGNGGRLTAQPVQTGNGTYAAIEDSRRASLTLYDGTDGVPLGGAAKFNTWIWADLFTDNTASAKHFYKALAGLDTWREISGSESFTVFTRNGQPRGGLVYAPPSQVEPNWLPYVLVADIDATIARARDLGGSVLAREAGTAILLDPMGAAIGVTTREGGAQ